MKVTTSLSAPALFTARLKRVEALDAAFKAACRKHYNLRERLEYPIRRHMERLAIAETRVDKNLQATVEEIRGPKLCRGILIGGEVRLIRPAHPSQLTVKRVRRVAA